MTLKRGTEIPTIDVSLVTLVTTDATPKEIAIQTASKIAVSPEVETQDAVKLIIKGILKAQKPAQKTITGNTIVLTDNVFTPEVMQILQGGTIVYAQVAFGTGNAGLLVSSKDTSKPITLTLVKPASANAALGVVTTGNDIVVNLATDGSQVATSTATAVKAALEANSPANALITVALAGTGATAMVAQAITAVPNTLTSYTPKTVGEAQGGSIFTLCAYSAIYNTAGIITGYEKIAYPGCQGVPVALSAEDGAFRVTEFTINSYPLSSEAPYLITYVAALPTL